MICRMGKTTTPSHSTPQARTFKEPTSRVVSVVVWAGSAVAVGWLLLAGRTGAATAAAPWLAGLSLLVYLTQWRPRLIVDAEGFEVVNGLRRHRIPFAAVDDIEVRHTVTLTAGGKKYVSWGAPTPPSAFAAGFEHARDWKQRPFGMLPSNERMSQSEPATGRDAIVRAWQDARHAAGGTCGAGDSADRMVTSRWNIPVLILGVLLAGWCLAAVIL